jgi:hypothetical protein
MGKKISIGITILLVSGLLAGWYFFTREAKYFGTPAFRAVPGNVPVIVRIHHLGNYTTRSLNNPIWKAYSGFPGVTALFQQLSFADSLFKKYPDKINSFVDKDLTVVFGGGNDHAWNLSLIELSGFSEKRAAKDFIDHYFSLKGAAKSNIQVGGADLSCYSWKNGEQLQKYCVTFYRGLFMASADREMVVLAVKQLETPVTQKRSVFDKANKTATDNIDLNIYLNHKELPKYVRRLFSDTFWERLKGSSPLAEWSEIDLTQKKEELLLNGFSFMDDPQDNYLGIFLHQKPDSFKLAEVFPAGTSFFLSYMISNNGKFFQDYENLLAHNNRLEEYKNSLAEINSLYGVDLQKMVVDNLDGCAAMVFTRPDPVMPHENRFLVLRVGSGSRMEDAMGSLTKLPGSNGKSNLSGNPALYKIDKETVFKIYKTPVSDFGKRIFGEVFSDVVTNYFTIYDNCLIMGASYESLCQFLRANVLQETLGNDQAYHEFSSGLSDHLNFYLWSSPGRSFPFFKETFNVGLYQDIENKIADFQKIESVGWQIGIENGMVYNLARLKYNPQVRESPASLIWKSHLGNPVINKPQFVINPADKNRSEIVVQDSEFNFILISNEGRVLWKIKLSGPIRSAIVQLDCFRNGKLQYFFSTDKALHLIDHEGNYIQHYPLALRSPATNGVSVFDYDHNCDYRFFIACKDHRVYAYDKKGNIVSGWTPEKTEHDVIQPVQFFRTENKDYIVFTDKNRGYILDRKGKTRVAVKGDISYSRNSFTLEPGSGKGHAHLVTTDIKGNIVSIGFDGSVKRFSAGIFSPEHYFIYDDFDSDKKRDYIFLDGDSLVVYNQSVNQIFKRKFNHVIGTPPELFTFPDNSRKIGVADSSENRIYLFNSDGSISNGFPIEGYSRFALGFSGCQAGQYNLITGTSDGYLNNYLIK